MNKKDIFTDNQLYPLGDDPVLAHFSTYFDRVCIGLIPFFILDEDKGAHNRAPRKIISLEEAQQRDPILKKLESNANRVIPPKTRCESAYVAISTKYPVTGVLPVQKIIMVSKRMKRM